MKKTIAILASALTAGALLIPVSIQTFAAQIDEAQAKEIAMNHAGVSADQVAYSHIHMDYENGRQVYDVEFYTTDYKEYDYEIEVSNGNILSFDYDAEFYERNQGHYLNSSYEPQTNPGAVSLDDAKNTALKHAGVSAENAVFVKTQTDYENGRQIYEIEFFTNDYKEYDYEIDTEDGSVVSYNYEIKAWQGTNDSGSPISADKAKELAAAQAGISVSDAAFIEFEQDYDHGRLKYEGKLIYGNDEYEFEIDANAGMIVDWGKESIYR